MTERIEFLRKESFEKKPEFSAERAKLITEFYAENDGKFPVPILRGLNFKYLCERKTIYLGDRELIVGERGPAPKAVSSFPELTCHSVKDLEILNSRKMQSYSVSPEDMAQYRDFVIPYWRGRSVRDKAFCRMPEKWLALYDAGVFTEFGEQRAFGHTALDGAIYKKGMLDFKEEIKRSLAALDFLNDPEATLKEDELAGMLHSCDAAVIFAERHARLAGEKAKTEKNPERKAELEKIAEVCRNVPARAPRDFWEALQMYWFVHLGAITELNGWDSLTPGHLDQHLAPFYEKDLAEGKITREKAKELLACLWIKVNNTPAPPKVGVTAAESGTYNDFSNVNLAGLTQDGRDGSSDLTLMILETADELRLLQPQPNVQVSGKTPDEVLRAAGRVIRNGMGYPSLFNADLVIQEQMRAGKTLEDAREGGNSGCVETGAFGKEAYILHGYLNTPKILELALNNGVDPLSGKKIGLETGTAGALASYEEVYGAFEKQLDYAVSVKIEVDNYLKKRYADLTPATFLSLAISDCIKNGKDYYSGGARYNSDYIQCTGIGTVTDSLSAIKKRVFEEKAVSLSELVSACNQNWENREALRLAIWNKTPFYGNDDDYADSIMQRVYQSLFNAIDGRNSIFGPTYHINMLSTTCHNYFGTKTGATPNGRKALTPISDGASPSHGADRKGPTAVVKSLSKMDQVKSGGTLLNQRFLPSALAGETGLSGLVNLVRSYFNLGGHHIQFNVVDEATLRDAQKNPGRYRNLLVRVAGYSDYFVDLDKYHQEEIIARTAQESF